MISVALNCLLCEDSIIAQTLYMQYFCKITTMHSHLAHLSKFTINLHTATASPNSVNLLIQYRKRKQSPPSNLFCVGTRFEVSDHSPCHQVPPPPGDQFEDNENQLRKTCINTLPITVKAHLSCRKDTVKSITSHWYSSAPLCSQFWRTELHKAMPSPALDPLWSSLTQGF